jgi:TetR/AcrR family transcriptional regulator, transcriptional repressor for nem operon
MQMRYSSDHKSETRSKIIDSASTALKKNGIEGTSIVQIMQGAGLTHGGFYAHFKSRDDLVCAVVTREMDLMIERVARSMGAPRTGGGLEALVAFYLSDRHVDDPKNGCPLPTMGADIARASRTVRSRFSKQLGELIDLVARQYPDMSPAAAERRAIATIATMVGAITIARANTVNDLSDRILDAARQTILDSARPAEEGAQRAAS